MTLARFNTASAQRNSLHCLGPMSAIAFQYCTRCWRQPSRLACPSVTIRRHFEHSRGMWTSVSCGFLKSSERVSCPRHWSDPTSMHDVPRCLRQATAFGDLLFHRRGGGPLWHLAGLTLGFERSVNSIVRKCGGLYFCLDVRFKRRAGQETSRGLVFAASALWPRVSA